MSPESRHDALLQRARVWDGAGLWVSLASILAASLVIAPLCLWLRRFAGALIVPLPASVLAGAMFVAFMLAVCLRQAFDAAGIKATAATWGPRACLLILGLALAVPGTSVWGWSVVLLAVAADALVALAYSGAGERFRSRFFAARRWATSPGAMGDNDSLSQLPPDVLQRLTRRRTQHGEVVEGVFRVHLAEGQRSENYHVSFCPPLAQQAEVTCRQIGGPAARVKVAQVLPQGVRVELRLTKPAEPGDEVLLHFVGRSTAPEQSPPAT